MLSKIPKISPSMRSAWRQCPRKVFYRYVAAIEPVRGKKAFAVGTAFHSGLEAWRSGCEVVEAGHIAANVYRNSMLKAGLEDDGYTSAQVCAYIQGYALKYFESDQGQRLIEVSAFEDDDSEAGFVDCILEIKGRHWIVEDKTAARFEDESAQLMALKLNDQIATYMFSVSQKMKIEGVRFRQTKKTLTYPKKNEGLAEYSERILGIYTETSDNYRELILEKNAFDKTACLKQRDRDNMEILSHMDKFDLADWPYNCGNCVGMYGPCEYLQLCARGKDQAQRLFKPNGKEPIDGNKFQTAIW